MQHYVKDGNECCLVRVSSSLRKETYELRWKRITLQDQKWCVCVCVQIVRTSGEDWDGKEETRSYDSTSCMLPKEVSFCFFFGRLVLYAYARKKTTRYVDKKESERGLHTNNFSDPVLSLVPQDQSLAQSPYLTEQELEGAS